MYKEFLNDYGLKYTKDNKSIIVQILSVTKVNHNFDETQIRAFIKAVNSFLHNEADNIQNPIELFGELFSPIPYEQTKGLTLYKYMTKQNYEKFVSKGKFRLGSLQYYRKIENKNARDEKEGYSNLVIRSASRDIFASLISGFNFYIFCGTNAVDESEYMKENFGEVVLRIPSIGSFADAICKLISAKRWYLYDVRYSDFKAYFVERLFRNIDWIDQDVTDEIFDLFYNASFHPSIFVKPCKFSKERELRLAFEMHSNVKQTLDFQSKGLLGKIGIESQT